MNERQRDYFRAKLLIWKDEILKEARTRCSTSRTKIKSSRSRRPRILRDRPRDRAARARPPAQADRQDRRRAPPHRGRHLRLLRGDRRADLAQAARGAPDRDAVDRGAGTPRAARAGVPGRLMLRHNCFEGGAFARPVLPGRFFVSWSPHEYTRGPRAGRAGGRVWLRRSVRARGERILRRVMRPARFALGC